jgi:F-type H+-transporting ATPase subunit epsilon
MADKLQLEVITPEKVSLRETVDEVILPAVGGELGILPEHAPLISQLSTGVMTYRQGNDKKQLHISGGFVEVLPDRISVLADIAEKPEEIDTERARKARERAEKRLSANSEDIDLSRAQLKLQRAQTRLQLGGK